MSVHCFACRLDCLPALGMLRVCPSPAPDAEDTATSLLDFLPFLVGACASVAMSVVVTVTFLVYRNVAGVVIAMGAGGQKGTSIDIVVVVVVVAVSVVTDLPRTGNEDGSGGCSDVGWG